MEIIIIIIIIMIIIIIIIINRRRTKQTTHSTAQREIFIKKVSFVTNINLLQKNHLKFI